jgi:hypothetical protein
MDATRFGAFGELHPSNRLSRGEINEPEGAIRAHIQCLQIEKRTDERYPTPEVGAFDWDKHIKEAEVVEREYETFVGSAKRAFAEKLVASTDDETGIRKLFGEALLARDFSSLAI